MAIVKRNIIVEGLSGSLGGQLVFQRGRGGRTIVRAMPTPSERPPTESQLTTRARFAQASAYARQAKDHAIYVEKARGTNKSAYNVAVADWFRPPDVVHIDLSQWHGGIGETLRMQVQDNVYVEHVNVLITDENGEMVETGSASAEANGIWWQYVTTVDHPGGNAMVVVSASDLPGNEGSLEVSKDVT